MNSNDTLRNTVSNDQAARLDTTDTVEQLNSFLRGEMSAVETYRQAVEKLQTNAGPGVALLNQLMASHATRVQQLKDEVLRFGGKPAEGSGVWGTFATLVQGAADLFGEKSAIAALEEGEDHGLKDYREGLAKLDGQTRQWVENNLFPEQKKTHNALRDFKKQLANAS